MVILEQHAVSVLSAIMVTAPLALIAVFVVLVQPLVARHALATMATMACYAMVAAIQTLLLSVPLRRANVKLVITALVRHVRAAVSTVLKHSQVVQDVLAK